MTGLDHGRKPLARLRHGHARHATVSLARCDDDVLLSITDDGDGFDPAHARKVGGLGLVSIEEGARLCSGQVTIQSQPGQGTTIDVRVPVGAYSDGSDPEKQAETLRASVAIHNI